MHDMKRYKYINALPYTNRYSCSKANIITLTDE